MRKNVVKLLGLLTAVALVFSMAACHTTATPTPVPSSPAAPTAAAGASAQPAPAATMDTSPLTLTLYCGDYWASNYIDPSWTDPLAQELTKRTGITLKVTVPASSDDEGEMNKMIASGNLPDLIFRTGGASKDTLETGGYTKPLDDLIAKYAPNITKYMSGSFPAWRNRTDGKIYCLGLWYWNQVCKPALNLQVNTLQMRYDILKDLGYAKLDRSTDGSMNSFITWQDYLNLLAQVKAKYPDMIPALVQPAGQTGNNFVGGALQIMMLSMGKQMSNGCDQFIWENNQAISPVFSPDFPWAVKQLNSLYQQGYANVNDTTTTDDARQAEMSDGKVFSCLGYSNLISNIQGTLSKDNDEKRFAMFYLVKDSSVTNIYMNGAWGDASAGIHINAKLDDAKTIRAMQFMDYCASPEGSLLVCAGVQGTDYTADPATGWYKPNADVFAGYRVWDANTLKKTGVGGWLDILPCVAGVTPDGKNCYDINAQYAFSQDPWVMYNVSDWKHFSFSMIMSPYESLDTNKQADAVDADSKISAYLVDRLANIVMSKDASSIDSGLAALQSQMKSDGIDALEKAETDNWNAIAQSKNVPPQNINQTPAQLGQ